MKKNQYGFGIVGIVFMVVILGVIGVLTWQAINHYGKNPVTQQTQSTTIKKSATDTAQTFSYTYPSDWTIQKFEWSQCCEGPARPEPDWTKQPQPITLKENHTTTDADISIIAEITDNTTVDSVYKDRNQDQFNSYTKLKVNGYDSLYHVTDFTGPGNAEKYKDYEYLVTHPFGAKDTEAVYFKFRERYSNSTLSGKNDFNASNLTPQFRSIVYSIHFLD